MCELISHIQRKTLIDRELLQSSHMCKKMHDAKTQHKHKPIVNTWSPSIRCYLLFFSSPPSWHWRRLLWRDILIFLYKQNNFLLFSKSREKIIFNVNDEFPESNNVDGSKHAIDLKVFFSYFYHIILHVLRYINLKIIIFVRDKKIYIVKREECK